MAKLSPERIAALYSAAKAATPGPWMGPRITDQWPPGWVGVYAADEHGNPLPGDVVGVTGNVSDGANVTQDAAFIAAASPDVVLALLDERTALTAKVTEADAEYDLLNAQLQDTQADYGTVEAERDQLKAEVDRLTACLAKANSSHETFERRWYLAQDEVEKMRPVCEAAKALRTRLPTTRSGNQWPHDEAALADAVDAVLAAEARTKCDVTVMAQLRAEIDLLRDKLDMSNLLLANANERIRQDTETGEVTTRGLFAQLSATQAALTEALDWAKRFDGRHDRSGGYSSELLPMFTRIGERLREDRLSELAKLGEQP